MQRMRIAIRLFEIAFHPKSFIPQPANRHLHCPVILTSNTVPIGKEFRERNMSTSCILTEVASHKSWGGYQKVFCHESKELGCKVKFGIYLPPQAEEKAVPVLYFLSGLTATEENFMFKSGAQRFAAEHGIILVNPDTSPRGLNIPGDSDAYDFGVGASFYINATELPWKDNYRMFSYINSELIGLVTANFNVLEGKQSITGHSMGGHGALISALKNPGLYKSVSAFAPIANPSECPWGIKAFTGYLGARELGRWADWDATELVKRYNGPPMEILIDQGDNDHYLEDKQLLPENLIKACSEGPGNISIRLNMQENYDHGFFFVHTFIGEHIKFHMKYLLED